MTKVSRCLVYLYLVPIFKFFTLCKHMACVACAMWHVQMCTNTHAAPVYCTGPELCAVSLHKAPPRMNVYRLSFVSLFNIMVLSVVSVSVSRLTPHPWQRVDAVDELVLAR